MHLPLREESLIWGSPTPSLPLILPLMLESIEAGYILPLIDLWTEQSSLGLTSYLHLHGALLHSLMMSLKKEKADWAHKAFEDRTISKLNDSYTIQEYH